MLFSVCTAALNWYFLENCATRFDTLNKVTSSKVVVKLLK